MTVAIHTAQTLTDRWEELLSTNPKLRIRNAAEELGVSEADLLATKTGKEVTRLAGDFRLLMQEVESLGTVMALTRNDAMVHEKTGQYKDLKAHGNMGLAFGDIDLRIFFSRFVHGFYCEETVTVNSENITRRSLQFFDSHGEAVHKIYAKSDTDLKAFDDLVGRYRSDKQTTEFSAEEKTPQNLLNTPDEIDRQALDADWRQLKDVHHFQAMLKKHKLDRIPAYHLIGTEFAEPLAPEAFEAALTKAAEKTLSIMVFVGSEGVVQIHTGPVKKLMRTGPWFNVLDPGFNLHANTELIRHAWIIRKPTKDGIVTSLEVFDADGKQLALLFGERTEGQQEMPEWKALTDTLIKEFPAD